MAKISVIIPVYNVENYLRESMDSVINQTLKDIEIICIDDCSTDNSLKILEDYAQKDSRIKILRQVVNKGQGAARNKALDLARGEYIMFLDPDDWLELNACETAYNLIAKNKNDFAYFNIYHYNDLTGKKCLDKKRLKHFIESENWNSIKFSELTGTFMAYGECFYKIYNREFLDRYNIRFTNARCCEDMPFYIKAVVNAKTVSVTDIPLYNYRQRKTSTIANVKNRFFIFYAKNLSYKYILSPQHRDKFLKYYLITYVNSLVYHYSYVKKYDEILEKKFYIIMRRVFQKLAKQYNIEELQDYIDYQEFLDIVNKDWDDKFTVYIDIPYIIKCQKYIGNYIQLTLFNSCRIKSKNPQKFIHDIFLKKKKRRFIY